MSTCSSKKTTSTRSHATVLTLQHQFEQPSARQREVTSTLTKVEEKGSGLGNAL